MFDFKKVEQNVLSFWKERKIFEKSLEIRSGSTLKKRKNWVFWEGPPTANGRPGTHHLLPRAFKDLFCRYKTMRGFYVLRKAGWDTHGLPVELEVEKELGFKNKKDIEKFGIAEFNKKAKESVWKYKTEWEEMTKRMGFWLDLENPYITYETKYIESLWAIIKKIWDKGLLYLAHRVVPFCTRCGTALSSHEVAQGYKSVIDRSVYIKFKIISSDPEWNNTSILSWTTTPWTLPGNVALAINKSHKFICISDPNKDDSWLVLELESFKRLIKTNLFPEKIKHEFSGDDKNWPSNRYDIFDAKYLLDIEYEPLFNIKELKSSKSYKIYDADFVSTEDGTGVVHMAVMYGEDDYNLGIKLGLSKFHTVDEQGRFINVNQELNGRYVKDPETDKLIINYLTNHYSLLIVSDYEHDYPFCWRCDTPLIYYAKESWFIKMSAVNKQLLKNNQEINWVPSHIKEGRFGQWLKEGKDWAFSRERYWATPLPIWICSKQKECGNHLTVGSLDDLEKYRYRPKNEYYILRHGHSEKNGEGDRKEIISSKLENDRYHLTKDGKEKIEEVAKKLKKLGRVDIIISSPFIRTQETAKIIAGELDLKVDTEIKIGEFQHGSLCEGKSEHSCFLVDKVRNWENKTPDGESWKEVRRRMSSFLRDLDSKHEGEKILLVSHGEPIWLLKTFALGLSPEEALLSREELYPPQGELIKIDFKNYPYDEEGNVDLHRPYIDSIVLKCPKCGSKMTKIPDVIDVWFDSGAMPYAQWHWPFDDKDMIDPPSLPTPPKYFWLRRLEKLRRTSPAAPQFPADYIAEAIDQTRGWFYTLLAISTLLDKGAPYKNVISLSHVLDEKGQKMSKSRGNVVSPFEVMDKFGVDAARWYFYTVNSPGDYKLFSMKDVGLRFHGFITTLDNCVRFYELYATELKDQILTPHALDFKPSATSLLDKWILSKLNGLVSEVTSNMEIYEPTLAAREIEKFIVDDLSNWWLRRSRKRKEALSLLRFLLLEISKIIAPFTPFIAEDIHRRLHKGNSAGTESVHLHDWPTKNESLIDKKLEEQMGQVRNIVTSGLALRKEKQIKVRQPLAKIILRNLQPTTYNPQLLELIKEELNVKEVIFDKSQKEEIVLDTELSQALLHEGYARELIRQIQDMRKEAKYRLDEKVFSQWHSDDKELSEAINKWSEEIKKEVLLSEFLNSPHDKKAYDVEKEFELIVGKSIWVGIRR